MIHKKFLVAVTAVLVMGASEAHATAILTVGNNPQPDENVLLNTALTGTSIFGTTNQTGLSVRFTGEELITAPASGQARIDSVDGLFSYLMIDVPGGSFTSLILNPDATIDGTVDFTAITNTGIEMFNNVAVSGNGQNFFTFTTLHGQRFTSISLRSDAPLLFEDAAQFRIGGAQLTTGATAVPDGGVTFSFLGCTLGGLGLLRRKFNV